MDQNATETQIRDAYKTLAMAFHPDKHPDDSRKELAEKTFQEIHKAYQVLSNPEQRAVYDHFGEEGLNSTWSVATRGQSMAEMRAEFERQSRLRQAADAESLVNARGEFSAVINATSLFLPPANRLTALNPALAPTIQQNLTWSKRVGLVSCAQIVGKHGFDMQISDRSMVSVTGQLMSRGNAGGGNLVGTIKTQWSPRFFSEMSASLLRPHVLTTKGQYTVDENVFFNYAIVSQTLAAPPSVTLTYGQRLSSISSLTGFTSIKTGTYTLGGWGADADGQPLRQDVGAMVVGVTKQQPDGTAWTFQCTLADTNQSLSYEWAMKVLGGFKIKTGLSLGTATGFTVFTNSERRVTENVRVMMGVECGLASGVLFKLRVVRLGQRLVFPIVLSPTFRADLVAAATLVPAAAMALSHYFYFVPARKRLTAERLAQLREERMDEIEQRRNSAEQTRELLRAQARKRAESEWAKQGLIVLQAYYGRRDTFPAPQDLSQVTLSDKEHVMALWQQDAHPAEPSTSQPLWWDVQVPLQMLVSQSQLVIPAGRSKSKLIGFFDPCVGERKQLYVRFLFRGQLHEFTCYDTDAVAAPLRCMYIAHTYTAAQQIMPST